MVLNEVDVQSNTHFTNMFMGMNMATEVVNSTINHKKKGFHRELYLVNNGVN